MWLDFLLSRPDPSLPLIAVFPVTHPIGVKPHLMHDILDLTSLKY
ncbi:hypothetical protein OAT11_04980 [Nitrospinaceae bacterium]|nr:hypothetical protein [Nitrospinaceae bacterium]